MIQAKIGILKTFKDKVTLCLYGLKPIFKPKHFESKLS